MTDDEAKREVMSQILGEVMLATGMAQMLCLTLAIKKPDWRTKIEAGLDGLLFQWDGIAANPNHAIPGALAHCRQRMEEFLTEGMGYGARCSISMLILRCRARQIPSPPSGSNSHGEVK